MKSKKVYAMLEKDFILPGLSDDWAQHMSLISEYLSDNFKKRSMGLVCDFNEETRKVYTAVFPSKKVMERILRDKATDAMFFVHHPSIWDIRKAPEVFQQMDRNLLDRFKQNRVSIFNLHVPLDNFSEYSTSVTLAEELGVSIQSQFAPYFGSMCGVFGSSSCKTVNELKARLESALGHKAVLYDYGDDGIKDRRVAIIGGGGNEKPSLKEILDAGINTFVTGITAKNSHSAEAHEFAEENGINILGGTHYSTEKFACIKMCKYFEKAGLPAEFLPDEPVFEDM